MAFFASLALCLFRYVVWGAYCYKIRMAYVSIDISCIGWSFLLYLWCKSHSVNRITLLMPPHKSAVYIEMEKSGSRSIWAFYVQESIDINIKLIFWNAYVSFKRKYPALWTWFVTCLPSSNWKWRVCRNLESQCVFLWVN